MHDEELTAVGVWSGIGHRHSPARVRSGPFDFVPEAVAGSATAGPGWVASLDHEAGNHPVEEHAIVEAILGEKDEVVDGLRRPFSVELDLDVSVIGVQCRCV